MLKLSLYQQMKPDTKEISFKEALSFEVQQFVDKMGKISQDYQVQFQADRFQMFDSVLSCLMPASENEPINNQSLSSFLQSTLNNQTEKKLKKLYCTKQITRVSNNTKLFGNINSPNAFQNYIHGTLLSHISQSSSDTPFHPQSSSSFHRVVPLNKLKEEPSQSEAKSDSSSLYQARDSEIKKNYKLYPTPVKLEIIQHALRYGTKDASSKYKVAGSKITHWTRSLKQIKQTRGRKPINPEMEEKVCIWLKTELQKGLVLTQKIIREKAKAISGCEDFKASKGWLQKFFKRRPELFDAYTQNRKNAIPDGESDMNEQQEMKQKQDEIFHDDPPIKIQELFLEVKSQGSV